MEEVTKETEVEDSMKQWPKDTPVRLNRAVSKIHAITSDNYNEIWLWEQHVQLLALMMY